MQIPQSANEASPFSSTPSASLTKSYSSSKSISTLHHKTKSLNSAYSNFAPVHLHQQAYHEGLLNKYSSW